MAKLWTAPATSETLSNFNGKIVFLIHCPQWMQDKSFSVLKCQTQQGLSTESSIYIYVYMLSLYANFDESPGFDTHPILVDDRPSSQRIDTAENAHGTMVLTFCHLHQNPPKKKLEGFLESFPCKYYLGQNKNVSFLWMPVKTNLFCRVSCVLFLELLSNFGAK